MTVIMIVTAATFLVILVCVVVTTTFMMHMVVGGVIVTTALRVFVVMIVVMSAAAVAMVMAFTACDFRAHGQKVEQPHDSQPDACDEHHGAENTISREILIHPSGVIKV